MSQKTENIDESKQPLIQHLVELRSRLIKSLLLISVLFVSQRRRFWGDKNNSDLLEES